MRRKWCGFLLLVALSYAWGCDDEKAGGDLVETKIGDVQEVDAPESELGDVNPDQGEDLVAETDDLAPDGALDTETSVDLDAVSDTNADVADEGQVPQTFLAVSHQRCPLATRVAQVDIEALQGQVWANAWVFDRPNPAIGEAALRSEHCVFHTQPTGCGPCALGEVCGANGHCASYPEQRSDVSLHVQSATETQTFTVDPWGGISAQIDVGAPPYRLDLVVGAHTIQTEALSPPGPLGAVTATVTGGSEAPTHLLLNWSGGAPDAQVFTHIPINHHVGGPTFTECQAPASLGSFGVEEAMLAPLAVSTGLEFQSVEHVVFAAAETPVGCFEFRFLQRSWPQFN